MNRFTRLSLTAALALSATALVPSMADASDRRRFGKLEAKIDDLDARLQHSRGWLSLEVRYKVEVEDARRFVPLDLVLTVFDRGQPVFDHQGRPLVIVIPLEHPTDVDDDEYEFERRINVPLSGVPIFGDGKLRLEAELVMPFDGRVLDRDKTKIDNKLRLQIPVWNDRPPIGRPWPRR